MPPAISADIRKLPRRELLARLERNATALAAGRAKGAQVQRLGAALRQSLIDRSVGDLLRNAEASRWRDAAIVDFIFARQAEIGLRPAYSKTSLDRRVRTALRKYRTANLCQSPTKICIAQARVSS